MPQKEKNSIKNNSNMTHIYPKFEDNDYLGRTEPSVAARNRT